MELLTVMAIMALLSTLAVTGYFSAVRGMAKTRGVSGLMNALTLARQRACTDGAKTSVLCFNTWSGAESLPNASASEKRKACTPTYLICKAIGQLTYVSGNELGDEFTPLNRLFTLDNSPNTSAPAPVRLYNLTRGGYSDVLQTVKRIPYPGTAGSLISPENGRPPYSSVLLCFTRKKTVGVSGDWKPGDTYGVAVSPVASLPKNVYFGSTLNPGIDSSSSKSMVTVEFFPDGSATGGLLDIVMLRRTSDSSLTRVSTVKVSTEGIVSSD